MSQKNNFKISVVTVVFNDVARLEKTILSVLDQSYANLEYIVIDGGSTDGSIEIIKSYENRISYWVSENDDGIYDAMNKGISKSTGSFINFMNAGDSFYSRDTINNSFHSVSQDDLAVIDVMYGNHFVDSVGSKREVKPKGIHKIKMGSQFCHQSAFIATEYHKKNRYNIRNSIAADFEFFYNAYTLGRRFEYIDETISIIAPGGVSDLNRVASIVSWWNVVEKHTCINLYFIFRVIREIIVGKIKRFCRLMLHNH